MDATFQSNRFVEVVFLMEKPMWRRDKRYVKVITECDKETMEGKRKIGRNSRVHDYLLGLGVIWDMNNTNRKEIPH